MVKREGGLHGRRIGVDLGGWEGLSAFEVMVEGEGRGSRIAGNFTSQNVLRMERVPTFLPVKKSKVSVKIREWRPRTPRV